MPTPPVCPTRPHVHREHGVERSDPWHWLRDKKDPETVAYIEAENAYLEAMTADQEGLRKALYSEMLGRIQETDTGAKIRRGPWRSASLSRTTQPVRSAHQTKQQHQCRQMQQQQKMMMPQTTSCPEAIFLYDPDCSTFGFPNLMGLCCWCRSRQKQ